MFSILEYSMVKEVLLMKSLLNYIIVPCRCNRFLGTILFVLLLCSISSCVNIKSHNPSADITGTWVGVWSGDPMMGEQEIVYELKSENGIITGYQKMSFNTDSYAVNGKINGNRLELIIRMESFGASQDYVTTGEISDNELRITPAIPGPPGGASTGIASLPSGDEKPQGNQTNPPVRKMQAGPVVFHRGIPSPSYKPGSVDYNILDKISLPEAADLPWNGLAETPPMGWNSWNRFHEKIDDETVREIADAMVSSGMKDAGYNYIVIDDGWQWKRNDDGILMPNPKFPDMKALADYVHSKGLKLGIYSSPGPRSCGSYEGSYGHEETDAKTWAEWGIDYLKYDWCSAGNIWSDSEMRVVYQKMGEALQKTGRPIVYSLCQYGRNKVQEWGPSSGGNLWRTTHDISDQWEGMATIGFSQSDLAPYAGPGKWNDPDMLEVGNGGMSTAEYKTHFSLWAMIAAPLIAGNDLRDMTEETKEILMNKEVIAVDQDPLGKGGYQVSKNGETEIWIKPLAKGDTALAFFNRGASETQMSVKWSDLKIKGDLKIRDLWAHKDLAPAEDGLTVNVESHGVVMVRISK
jgi:alpha-galactosidase